MSDSSIPRDSSRSIIRNGVITADDWVHVADEAAIPETEPAIVSMARWQRERDALISRDQPVGIRVPAHLDPAELADDVARLDLIAVDIERFGDGRLFTLARLLRSRLGFEGEMRACGAVHPDQVFYMKRVGFNAFELESPARLQAALRALQAFTVCYQGADDDLPLYRYR
ncbi:MAG: DUF934 domain-containing protein [Myxococcales bacterium FL481]|nr:MAG: DUF934 domain-containing protein [Myxococcales bacterium FL481]